MIQSIEVYTGGGIYQRFAVGEAIPGPFTGDISKIIEAKDNDGRFLIYCGETLALSIGAAASTYFIYWKPPTHHSGIYEPDK